MAEILFVDDEEILCDIAEKFFSLKKHNITIAHNSQDAEACLEQQSFDVILLDIHIPGRKNGRDLFYELSKKKIDAQIVLITAQPSLDTATDAVRLGAFDYLVKPFDLNTLSAVVDRALQARKSKEENLRLRNTLEKYQALLEKTLQEQLHEIRSANEHAQDAHIRSLKMLARAAEYHDDDTALHISRVGEYSAIIAREMGLSEEDQNILRQAAPMHDVGKVGIPYQLLTKPGKLTPTEFDLIKQHCMIGYEILKDEDHPYHKASAVISLSHHERWDGSGYPQGLEGDDIPLYGRIVAVADVFDALVSERCYKKPWSWDKAKEEIRKGSGSQFDPLVVEAFLSGYKTIEATHKIIEAMEQDHDHHEQLARIKGRLVADMLLSAKKEVEKSSGLPT